MKPGERYDELTLDRVRELTSIGAGHAANALASLTGRTCEMRVPTLRMSAAAGAGAGDGVASDLAGVLFEFEGGPGGVLALLFSSASCTRLLAALLGPEAGELRSEASRSALCEVGNILASHAANAVGELLGVTVLPSVPRLALDDAGAALAALLAQRAPEGPGLRAESEICDRAHELCGLFVFAPDHLELAGAHGSR